MEIIRIPLSQSAIPIPPEGLRDIDEPPIKYGLENILHSIAACFIPDPENIVVTEGTTPANSLGATATLNIVALNTVYPVSWLNTGTNKLKFRVKATLSVSFAGNLDTFLSTFNCIVINTNIAATPYGGFLVLTIGKEGSNADLILTKNNFIAGKFVATINRVSEEF